MDASTLTFVAARLVATLSLAQPGVAGGSVASSEPPAIPAPELLAAEIGLGPIQQANPYTRAYYQRLNVHRAASYAMLPLFALQVAAGTQLFNKSTDAPKWAKIGHRVGATGVAAMFATNLVTGVPNLVVSLKDPRGRGKKLLHGTLMLTAAAGFTATGLLAERAEGDPDLRAMHRSVAWTSMGISFVGWLTMLDWSDD